jgi:GWxTD domain-containing protein
LTIMPRTVPLLLLATIPTIAPRLTGQANPCPAQAPAAQDTSALASAIAACEALVVRDTTDAESRYRAGRLHLARYLAATTGTADRERAAVLFDEATQLQPDSGRYWLGLAEVTRTYGDILRRLQVSGLVDRAVAAARTHGSGELADIEYRAGVISWERYEQMAHRYLFIGDAVAVNTYNIMNEWKDLETFFANQVKPDPGDPGGDDRRAAAEHLRAALAADPRHVDAAGLLAVALGEEGRWTEVGALAEQVVRAAPDSGRAWAILGTARARENRWKEAQAAFITALTRMTAAQAAPYCNLGVLLKAVDQARYAELPPAQQAALDSVYWAVTQPLFLTDLNEPQVEFYARLTEVLHRWSDPFRGTLGYESDRGQVYLRYGPPEIWASFGRGRQSGTDAVAALENERNTIVWVYPSSQLRFMFSMTPGFGRTVFAGDFRTFYDEARNLFPVRFDNVRAVADMDTILVQFVQFRGEGTTSNELGVYSFMPIGRMARGAPIGDLALTTGAIVRDLRMRDVQRDRRQETIKGGDSLQVERRSFRFELVPGNYLLRVEAQLPAVERAARSTSVLSVRPYGTDSLMLSDVLVAERVAPRDSSFTRWTDFFVVPRAGRFTPNAPVGLLWEIYNLEPDSTGRARYTVDVRITVRGVERKGFAARILGGIGDAMGLSAKGDDEVSLRYQREATVRRGGRQVEYLTVDLEDAPKAEYAITLTVTDRLTGKSASALRRIVVTDTPLVRQ